MSSHVGPQTCLESVHEEKTPCDSIMSPLTLLQVPYLPRGGAEDLSIPGSPRYHAQAASMTSTLANGASACSSGTLRWRASSSATVRRRGRLSLSCVTSANLHSSRRRPRAAWTARPATATSASSCTTRGVRPKPSTSTSAPRPTSGPRQVPLVSLLFRFVFHVSGLCSVEVFFFFYSTTTLFHI